MKPMWPREVVRKEFRGLSLVLGTRMLKWSIGMMVGWMDGWFVVAVGTGECWLGLRYDGSIVISIT